MIKELCTMDQKIVDARGLSCPQPVIAAKKAADDGKPFNILVDNEVSKENVLRLAAHNGWQTDVRQQGEDIVISFKK
jgi:tRNA 2-thiouridine synthesizing protein A